MMTKVLYGSKKRGLVKGLMYDMFDSHDPIDKEGATVSGRNRNDLGVNELLSHVFLLYYET